MSEGAPVLGPIGELRAHAIEYAAQGLEVFPVNPHDKTPLVSQYNATTNTNRVDGWWEQWPTALIGHRIAETQVITDIDPRHGGIDTWQALKAEIGTLPHTRVHQSGRGDMGMHFWWQRPNIERLNVTRLDAWARERGVGHQAGQRWTCGIDLLHHKHRYTILPPSPHPDTHKPYQWVTGRGLATPPAPLPNLLVELLTAPAPPPPVETPSERQADSIADWYTSTHTWTELLGRHGWTVIKGDGDSDGSAWRHPQATSSLSATITNGCLFVYSTSTTFEPTNPSDPHGYTRFHAYAVLEHNGNQSEAARALRQERAPADDLEWIPHNERPARPDPPAPAALDISWVGQAFNKPPPEPRVLVDGLLRVGEFLGIASLRGIGKSFFAMNLAMRLAEGPPADLLGHKVATKARVLYSQGEVDPWASYHRWYRMTQGQAPEGLAETFENWRIKVVTRRTTDTLRHDDGTSTTSDEFVDAVLDGRIEQAIIDHNIDVLVIDPWAVYYAGNENSNDETEAALGTLRQLTLRHQLAVVIVHHVSKSMDVREPEDMWRGAGRLADWCTTRMTILPHYTPKQAAELGYTRQEARRFVDVKLLRRNEPTPDFSMMIDHRHALWLPWTPNDREGPSTGAGAKLGLTSADVAQACRDAGGWGSLRSAASALDVSVDTASRLLERAVSDGLLTEIEGRNNSRTFTAMEVPE